eukprot:gene26827-32975_t
MIVNVANAGLCFGAVVGIICDTFGGGVTNFLGAASGSGGYLLLYGLTKTSSRSTPLYALFFFLVGQGSQCMYMASLMNYLNFPRNHHGTALGILDCVFGLSPALFSVLYDNLFRSKASSEDDDLSGFYLAMSGIMAVTGLIGACTWHVEQTSEASDLDSSELRTSEHHSTGSLPTELYMALAEGPSTQNDSTFTKMLQYGRLLCNVDTGIIFCMFTICSGVGLLFINNTDFIADALYECSPDSSNKSTIACHRSRQLVDLFGWLIPLVSCGTRIFVGTVSDRLQKVVSRGALIVVQIFILLLGTLVTVIASEASHLKLAGILIGSAFGGIWCLTPLFIGDLFGSKSFGTVWGGILFGGALGPFMLQPFWSYEYKRHARSTYCKGTSCYSTTFELAFGVSIVALGMSLYVARKFRQVGQYI